MFPPKGTAGFAVRVLLFYGLLAWVPWPGVSEGYSAFYRYTGNVFVESLGSEVTIWFRPPVYDKGPDKDLEFAIRAKGETAVRNTPINTRLTGYLPTVEVIALILATPIPWRRRGWAVLWGFIGANVFVAFRLATTLVYMLCHQPPYIDGVTQFWSDATYRVFEIAMRSPTISFMVPIFVWILVTFRRGDWTAFLQQTATDDKAPAN